MKVVVSTVVMLVSSLFLSGCLPIWQGRALEDEVAMLRARQADLEAEASQREESLAEMIRGARDDIEELEAVLVEAREILSRDSANLGAEVQRNREELSQVYGELEELEFRFRRFQQTFELFRVDVDMRFDSGEAEHWPEDPEDLLEFGQALREDGEYTRARRAFHRFLSHHENHHLTAVARLELAEAYFAEEQWVSAIGEFQTLFRQSQAESHQSRSAMRIGESFVALGECERAKIFFETVVEDFPHSREVSEARRQLRSIERDECPSPSARQ